MRVLVIGSGGREHALAWAISASPLVDQLFCARPMLGYGNYRGPLQGLYMCGAGTHPGGGVTGAAGHNAAREILSDFRRGRLRRVA